VSHDIVCMNVCTKILLTIELSAGRDANEYSNNEWNSNSKSGIRILVFSYFTFRAMINADIIDTNDHFISFFFKCLLNFAIKLKLLKPNIFVVI
jgi:hypothetical protein